ncbi:39S ribosomal protein L33, mitochondrial, partial [Ophiophagus hannah]
MVRWERWEQFEEEWSSNTRQVTYFRSGVFCLVFYYSSSLVFASSNDDGAQGTPVAKGLIQRCRKNGETSVAKKTKSKYILVRMLSEAGTGCSFNVKRLRLQDKLVMLRYDRFDFKLLNQTESPLQRAKKDLFCVTDAWLRRFVKMNTRKYKVSNAEERK